MFRFQTDATGIDWAGVADLLRRSGMGHYAPERHERAFANSQAVVFVFHDGRMIGFGRLLSDGAYQAVLYDVAVEPEFQGQGLGRAIVQRLLERAGPCNVILYATPGKEGFYRKLGFRGLKTGMARFLSMEAMREKGATD